jgi:NADH-quinone oxidoreductase subunit N
VVLISLTLALLISVGYLRREQLEAPEYIALMVLSATGMMVMASANDLIAIFLALEILSIALYVLSAFDKRRLTSQEAGLKYFLLGAFSSAVFLYGVALVYGATGTTSLTGIAKFLAGNAVLDNGVLFVGFALLLVGLGFKIAAAPFHMWTPDVYQGAPTPVTAFMAGATKAAAFGAILRVFVGTFDLYRDDWRPAVFGLAVISMAVGTIAAVVQTDVKRMLAYSSIAHAGYVLIGVQAATRKGTSAALFYLLVYALMIIGAFAVVSVVARRGDERHSLDDYRGMARREPVLAGLLTLFLLAQAGVPLTGGFVAKLGVFSAAVDAGQYALALVGMLTAVISAFVYLRIVLAMYAPDAEAPAEDEAPLRVDAATGVALFLASVAVVVLGIVPGFALDFARDATLLLAR